MPETTPPALKDEPLPPSATPEVMAIILENLFPTARMPESLASYLRFDYCSGPGKLRCVLDPGLLAMVFPQGDFKEQAAAVLKANPALSYVGYDQFGVRFTVDLVQFFISLKAEQEAEPAAVISATHQQASAVKPGSAEPAPALSLDEIHRFVDSVCAAHSQEGETLQRIDLKDFSGKRLWELAQFTWQKLKNVASGHPILTMIFDEIKRRLNKRICTSLSVVEPDEIARLERAFRLEQMGEKLTTMLYSFVLPAGSLESHQSEVVADEAIRALPGVANLTQTRGWAKIKIDTQAFLEAGE